MKLSIVIPVYNEEKTVENLIDIVQGVDLALEKELITVNDGSTDGSLDILNRLAEKYQNLRVFDQPKNRGKGAALRRGFEEATGDIVIIQDADLEYNPQEYSRLINPILQNRADVVYGSRFVSNEERRVLYFWHSLGNQLLTLFSNMVTDLNLSDMETCYKVFKKEVIKQIKIEENRFGFEPEITAKISKLRPQIRIFEIGISYSGRTYEEGKKISWKDGVAAFWCILKYGVFR